MSLQPESGGLFILALLINIRCLQTQQVESWPFSTFFKQGSVGTLAKN